MIIILMGNIIMSRAISSGSVFICCAISSGSVFIIRVICRISDIRLRVVGWDYLFFNRSCYYKKMKKTMMMMDMIRIMIININVWMR